MEMTGTDGVCGYHILPGRKTLIFAFLISL